jgi:hypothetical protein
MLDLGGSMDNKEAGPHARQSCLGTESFMIAIAMLIAISGSMLLLVNQSGASIRRPLVNEATARSVITRIFPIWQRDMQIGDADRLRGLEKGIQLSLDTANCTMTKYVLYTPCPPGPMLGVAVIVPAQYSYPVRFLAEVKTSEPTQSMSSSQVVSKSAALELIVLTQASAEAPWLIAFQTSLYSVSQTPPPFLPAPKTSDGLARPVTPRTVRLLTTLPAELASYWQSWKTAGVPPAGTTFVPGPFTTSLGAYLATEPDGTVGDNERQNVIYSSNPAADGAFVFPVGFAEFTSNPTPGGIGYLGSSGMLVCSAIRVGIDFTPEPDGPPLIQDGKEIDFGPGLAPGEYENVLDESVHESCVLTDGQHLSALGADGDVFHQFGTAVSTPT